MTAQAESANRYLSFALSILAVGLGVGAILLPLEATVAIIALGVVLLLVIHTPITLLTALLVLS
ncbi:MAG: hypothetical protein CUN56_15950, partial [Phototrophicales bacterium]